MRASDTTGNTSAAANRIFKIVDTPQAYDGLRSGPHQFSVRAIDVAGNVSAPQTRNWTSRATASTRTATGATR